MSKIFDAANWLCQAHERNERFRPLPVELAPRTSDEAYAIQDAFVAQRAKKRGGIVGYKIALATAAMQKFVGVNAPQAGAILEYTMLKSGATVRAQDYVRLIVEFEIGVEMEEDLPALDAPHSRERVMQAVRAVMPAIELADDREADYGLLSRHPLDLIADNTWNEGAVLGPPVRDWQGVDLADVRGVASLNGKEIGEGRGADAMGHPLDAVVWIANHLASLGRGLLRDDVVITGSLVTSKWAKAGDVFAFRLDGLGEVELHIN
jgi:2-keto-4-pentenoate hydratase